MKTFSIQLSVAGAVDTITADDYEVRAGALVLYNVVTPPARPRLKSKVTVIAYGPSAWLTIKADEETVPAVAGTIPLTVLGDTEKALNNARRFASRFIRSTRNNEMFSETLRQEAERIVQQVNVAFKGLDPFMEELEDEDDDDD